MTNRNHPQAMYRLSILGPGTLGLSLAQWAAECGLDVTLVGRNLDHATQGLETIGKRWEGSLRKGRLQPDALSQARTRLKASGDLEGAIQWSDAFLEAIPESVEAKVALWHSLSAQATTGKLWATGSSGIPVSEIRRQSGFPLPITGFHLFVPVHHTRLVELVEEEGTATPAALALADQLKLELVQSPDQPGYLASRLALIQGLEAMRMVEQGLGTPSSIDALMARGYGHPCGPLELSDRVGLDLRLGIASSLYERTSDPAFAPPTILKQKVAQGNLGRKSGQGFYAWPNGSRAE